MTFDEILNKVRTIASSVSAPDGASLAVQVNLTGPEGGVFYVEAKGGNIRVEPYEYNDRDCAVTMSLDDFNKLIDGKLDPIFAFTTGKLKVDGDVGKALEFSTLIKK